MKITFQWPPSTNTYWRHARGRTFIGARGLAYRAHVHAVAIDTKSVAHMRGRLRVEIIAHPPDRRRRDIDNLLKALCDAMQYAGIYVDDSQIDFISVARGDVVRDGAVEVSIVEAES